MANPTSNFGWQMPTNTDLVKDLPADFEVFGQAVDTSLMDLKGGTTGQVLSKASNTDMDFTWVTSDDANAIQNTIVDAKGDLISATGNDVPARLAVGNNGESLVADSSATTGLRWNPSVEAGKNRIINGQMVIDQRNAGAAVTINTAANTYALDRWRGFGQATDGVFTIQQDSSAPSGFSKSAKITVTTADASIGSTQTYNFSQGIEGNNIVDFGFGSAGAKTITLSFWVRSSLTGTFGGSIRNNAVDRSYVFSYSISAADTWEKKSVTISGDTTGTWATNTDSGIILGFSLGAGTDRLETAGSWYGSNRLGATGQVQVIGTLNATWYVTGVQLELGSVATSFSNAGGTFAGEFLAAQRYYRKSYNQGTSPGTTTITAGLEFAQGYAALVNQHPYKSIPLNPPMRTAPTVTIYSYSGTTTRVSDNNGTELAANSGLSLYVGENSFAVSNQSGGNVTPASGGFVFHYTASAEL